ncbi:pyruvate kinase [Corynebacterium jeikeium]|uniref:pyruvate kinase n=1 Tax=Corynebacterium jeikeium TaxID=38289 RepID=UPI0001B7189F|nr:pyruvate kinase [Corynebacterium jeikeium]EEW17057.1 putative Pyruvate kinase, barrel domain protein [Corynebacterium jeikeium ATCC 43734]OOD30027.1 pyruvate kinase [Corynebacterium jeikeium]WCZ53341.1 Pyruvate kinase I [Corynebacterium jeikeium]SUY81348.1 pyruvate kinase [Corynebacterium jeikeium]
MQVNKQTVLEAIEELLDELDSQTLHWYPEIRATAPTHFVGARNLVHYTTLRTSDRRGLQGNLESLGATRLSTAEPAVKARLQAAHNVVSALDGRSPQFAEEDVADAIVGADELLEQHTEALFGTEALPGDSSYIMVTLPIEAAYDQELVARLVDSGMELARINCAHDGPEVWKRMIDNVRAAGKAAGRYIPISMDLAGPKIRTGRIAPGPAVVRVRVQRDDAGTVIQPCRLWMIPEDQELAEAPMAENTLGRPIVSVHVSREFFDALEVGETVRVVDARGKKRKLGVIKKDSEGALAEGQQNIYLQLGAELKTEKAKTAVGAVPQVLQKLRPQTGDRIVLTSADVVCDPQAGGIPKISCTLPEAVRALEVGQQVLFDDGAIAAKVVEIREAEDTESPEAPEDTVEAELLVTRGGAKLAEYKGINLPDTELPLPSLTEEDEAALAFVAEHADMAAVSFIRTREDVAYVLEKFRELGADDLGLVLKIETIPAFENLTTILLEGMQHAKLGVMLARGDLAVEMGFARMAEVPGQVMAMVEAAHVPLIIGTQVLESMAKSGLPTRAEITDVAWALRAECIMLNKGPHIPEAIAILREIGVKMDRSQRKNRMLLHHVRSWQ